MMIEDEDLYDHLRSEFAPVRMRLDVDSVSARGRSMRRRRRTTTTAGTGLVVAAVIAGLLLGLPGTQTRTDPPPRMDLAAWSVEPEPDGTVLLTIRQLADANLLSATLRRAGVPALVEFKLLAPGQMGGCAEHGQPRSPVDDVLTFVRGERQMAIRPDRMPPGTTLHIVIFQTPSLADPAQFQRSVHLGLVNGEPSPCATL